MEINACLTWFNVGKIIVVLINPEKNQIAPDAFEGANLYSFLFGML